jgi:hypothetical protein
MIADKFNPGNSSWWAQSLIDVGNSGTSGLAIVLLLGNYLNRGGDFFF